MKFRPCIDIHKGKVKQIVGSSLKSDFDNPVTNFETDLSPAHFARMYKNDGLFGGHVIMLGEGNQNAAIEALKEFPNGLQIGGGISVHNAKFFLDQGASHVIVTSCIFKEGRIYWENLEELVETIGKKRIVLDLSCVRIKDEYVIATDRWQRLTSVIISSETLQTLSSYCDEFLIHAAHVEGKRLGIDETLVGLLGNYSPIPVTYAGGIRSIEDLEAIKSLGKNRVDATIGSALDIFGGSLSYKLVVEWHKKQNQ
jgi:phosphoribosylformimino-5-aminoimidazole carboxamide ribotide isomerase